MKTIVATFLSILLFETESYGQKHSSSSFPKSKSFYTKQLMDSDAVDFTPENFNIEADGSMDASDALQQALYDLKETQNFGILFLPEGKYLVSQTIYVPQADIAGEILMTLTIMVAKAEQCFVAPDGIIIIPKVYDLARATCLSEAFPNKTAYVTDEYDKRTVKLDVNTQGYINDLKYFVEKGEFGTAEESKGNVYIADGEIYMYDPQGKFIKEIKTPERPTSIVVTNDDKTLYITSTGSLFSVALQ